MWRIRIIAALPLTLITLAAASRAHAQQPAAGNGPVDTTAVTIAASLEAEAVSYYPTTRKYKQAAKLLLRAASLRAGADVKGIDDLVMAARLSFYVRDLQTAQTAIEQAADRALRAGYPGRAADAYLDAGYVALARKDENRARELFLDAWRLAHSPHLTQVERTMITARLAAIRQTGAPLAVLR
jgi:hypothetical protein